MMCNFFGSLQLFVPIVNDTDCMSKSLIHYLPFFFPTYSFTLLIGLMYDSNNHLFQFFASIPQYS